jgi:hypothetical protein
MTAKQSGVVIAVFVLGVAVLLLGTAVPSYAHHGFNVEFDASKCMDLHGTLTNLTWENPHAYFDMEVKDDSGKAMSWHLEMITPNALKRNGTTRQDFEANMGKLIWARACPARAGAGETRGAAEYIKMADGIIRIVGQVPERNMTPEKLSFYNSN